MTSLNTSINSAVRIVWEIDEYRLARYQYHLPLVTHNPTDFEIIEELELITTVS
ncbi:hypothetical protein M1N79_05235 [Dehalococcoidia bacterium]|nr:hypothetical protein [Dehalococcoidia bacterium]